MILTVQGLTLMILPKFIQIISSVITTKISGINSGINRKMRMDIIKLINLITGSCYSIKELFIIDYNINMNIIQKRKGESLWRSIRSTK